MAPDYRPNPDELLKGITRAQHKTNRGKLKVFFGMCPGVGKTYAMLRAAQEKKASGVRVAVGLVETHQRAETENLLQGLELFPRRKAEYKGTIVEEFDLDLALERKPELILVDELAHTNAPGSRHPKRYQDVKDLLHAGIDVFTTMNVQHIESRADLVYQISGVPVRETVPDIFLEFSDQIELIDLSPEDLLKRLKDGKVYLGDRAERAAEGFFREEKLTALRELALRFTAEVVDDHLRDHRQTKGILSTWNTNERLIVAVSHSPFSARLIRSTRRMAFSLEAPWVALHVDTGTELTAEEHEMLTKHLNLARELGAEVITTKDSSVAEALKRVGSEKNVTQIVMGRPDRRPIRDWLSGGNILEQLVNETSEVDIHVIRQKRKPIYRGFRIRIPSFTSRPAVYIKTALYVFLLCAIGYPLLPLVGYRAIGFGLLLGILPVATVSGVGPVLLSAGLSAVLWNFFFIPPQFTFAIREPEDGMMILAYFAVASVAGFLASRIKRQEGDLRQRERRSNILYDFGRRLAEANTSEEIATEGARSIELAFPSVVAVAKANQGGRLSFRQLKVTEQVVSDKDLAVATWAYDNHKKAGWKTDTLASSRCLCIPLRGRGGVIGVLLLYPKEDRSLSIDQENLIETICAHMATALERAELEFVSRENEVYLKSEKLHQALLNTVSHELRTPLTTIIGGATALGDTQTSQDASLREKLAEDVVESAERLNHTIENLMDMSRISSGVLQLNEHVFELNDFIRSLVQRMSRSVKSHRITLSLSNDDLFVKGDEKILEHVLWNLISNAERYSPAGSEITIRSVRNQSYAEFSVSDQGKGLPHAEINRVFDRFYRAPGSPPGGVGLGLSIAKSIVEAHGGGVFAANRTEGSGAVFRVILPYREIPAGVLG